MPGEVAGFPPFTGEMSEVRRMARANHHCRERENLKRDTSLDKATRLTTIVSMTIDGPDQRPIYVHQQGEYGDSGRSTKLRRLVPIHTGNHPKSFDENMRCNTT